MTICIAAICDMGRSIILAADLEVGIDYVSTELPDGKFHQIYPEWSVGIAGTVSNATEVIRLARKERMSLSTLSVDDVKPGIERAYRAARMAYAEGRYLASRGWTLADFMNSGSTKLPISTYSSIDSQISNFDFGAELIVAGFGDNDAGPSILTVRNPGIAIDHTKLGFWCVGSGSPAAQMSLFSRGYSFTFSREKAAYCVLEAKLNANSASGVGDKTHLFVHRRTGGSTIRLQEIGENSLKSMSYLYDRLKPGEFTQTDQEDLEKLREFESLQVP